MKKLKIIISDKQSIFRSGLLSVFNKSAEFEVCAQVEIKSDLLKYISRYNADILIIDFEKTDEFETNDFISLMQSFPELKILILTNIDDEETILKVLNAGVHGYLLKDCYSDDLIAAIQSLRKNEKAYCAKVVDVLFNQHKNKNAISSLENKSAELTHKEKQIVQAIAEGKTTKEMAGKLFISIHTINSHRKNIFKKLEVRNSSELIMYAIKKGWVDTTEYYI